MRLLGNSSKSDTKPRNTESFSEIPASVKQVGSVEMDLRI